MREREEGEEKEEEKRGKCVRHIGADAVQLLLASDFL